MKSGRVAFSPTIGPKSKKTRPKSGMGKASPSLGVVKNGVKAAPTKSGGKRVY